MLFWFAGLAFLAAWVVFRDPALDHRLIVAGALLPDLVDAPTGGVWLGHTVAGSVLLLAAVMILTRGRRGLRRQLLALPIGTLLHLVLDGAWADTDVFWWPAFGFGFGSSGVPALERGLANLPLEVVGLGVAVWAWRRFRLTEAGRRRQFLRTGRLGRDLVP
ncbi:MAG: hypothetical protein M3R01_02015 [Actinomycetota bacterium]|nr:hypothetical protein [Actinomycetota bacterium]